MLQLDVSEEDKRALHYERFHHAHPRVQQKMETVWLRSQGIPHHEAARLAGVSENTAREYVKDYLRGGIAQLKTITFHRPQSRLVAFQSTIEAYFREHPPMTSSEAAAEIEKLTGIRRSPTQVRQFLRNMGMRCRKVGALPAKANPDIQEAFKETELLPRLEQAKAGQRQVYFVDAAHFVFAAFLGWLWSFSRLFVRSPSGRQRFNVLAALDAMTHAIVTVENTAYINAQSVCDLLRQIAALKASVPITLVMDNARYQRCVLVMSLAQQLGIELLFLPSYSPNLNLIERLWKFVKKKCLYSKTYPDFAAFQKAISACINEAGLRYKQELDSLLTLNFQSFKNTPQLPHLSF